MRSASLWASAGGVRTAEPANTESRKVINDAAAYIRGLADLTGRNAEWAVEAKIMPSQARSPAALPRKKLR